MAVVDFHPFHTSGLFFLSLVTSFTVTIHSPPSKESGGLRPLVTPLGGSERLQFYNAPGSLAILSDSRASVSENWASDSRLRRLAIQAKLLSPRASHKLPTALIHKRSHP